MPFRAVLFDLDGTLLNTLTDIARAANSVLVEHGFPTHPVEAYRDFVGDGVIALFARTLPAGEANEELAARCAETFPEAYRRCWNKTTRPYEGIPELLDALSRAGLPMAVLSNKPDEFVQMCVREYLSAYEFAAVMGASETVPRKPDPTGARRIAAALRIPAEQFLYLGDTATDMRTARAVGMRPVGALWGFRPRRELAEGGAEAMIEHPRELLRILDGSILLP